MKPVRMDAPRAKYGNHRVTYGGRQFASAKEGLRWLVLYDLEARGLIKHLRCQVRYPLHAPGGAIVAHYVADFVYVEDGQEIVEDVKGYRTAAYKRSRRHMLAEYGIAIRET